MQDQVPRTECVCPNPACGSVHNLQGLRTHFFKKALNLACYFCLWKDSLFVLEKYQLSKNNQRKKSPAAELVIDKCGF